ncbi:MAG: Methionine aminopeptidase [Parcubacteria group bacterium GW2011_GWE2_38_18]|nr:MAG: Methionine aminopeptidase [Parcubacteria group bacterium GW2011_GWE2_38_18]
MIIIKTKQEIEIIHEGGKKLSKVLKQVLAEVKAGVTTETLETLACDLIERAGGRPAFKGYKQSHHDEPYPTALCVSINDEVVHAPALPSRTIKEGDVVSIDVGMEFPFNKASERKQRGLFTDMAATVAVGKVDERVQQLIKATKKSLELAIEKVKPGVSLYEIGKTIEDYIEKQGFKVVKDLVGHGVGKEIHEDPMVPNYPMEQCRKILLKPGMVIAIEPMVNIGRHHIITAPDGLSIKTADGSISAHFEHTVAVTETGHIVLTE